MIRVLEHCCRVAGGSVGSLREHHGLGWVRSESCWVGWCKMEPCPSPLYNSPTKQLAVSQLADWSTRRQRICDNHWNTTLYKIT